MSQTLKSKCQFSQRETEKKRMHERYYCFSPRLSHLFVDLRTDTGISRRKYLFGVSVNNPTLILRKRKFQRNSS